MESLNVVVVDFYIEGVLHAQNNFNHRKRVQFKVFYHIDIVVSGVKKLSFFGLCVALYNAEDNAVQQGLVASFSKGDGILYSLAGAAFKRLAQCFFILGCKIL